MAMKTDDVTFRTPRSVEDLGRALSRSLSSLKSEAQPIISDSGALSGFDDRAEIEVVADGQTLLGGMWAVQIYVFDHGLEREVALVALGDGGFARAWAGARNSVSLAASVKKRDVIASSLR